MSLDAGETYLCSVVGLASPSGTIIQIKASSTVPILILEVKLVETASTTSTKLPCRLISWGTAMSGGNTGTITKTNGGEVSATATALTWKSGQTEGTTETDFDVDASNFLGSWLVLDTPKNQILIPASGNIAIYCPSAPPGTYAALVKWQELT